MESSEECKPSYELIRISFNTTEKVSSEATFLLRFNLKKEEKVKWLY